MLHKHCSFLSGVSLSHPRSPLRVFFLGVLALVVSAFAGPAWSHTQLGIDIDGAEAGDQFGNSVSLSGDGTVMAIGAKYHGDGGHVRVYEHSNGSWIQVGADIDAEGSNDLFGYSVSLSSDGTVLAIGAMSNDGIAGNNSGHVRLYERNGNAWAKIGSDIDGESSNDLSGYSVSLSSDGTRVAIGATMANSSVSDSGHVRIYDWNGVNWAQVGGDIDGEAGSDYSGRSVSLSSDGTLVAIGAYSNDGNGSASGHVRVYEYSDGAWTQVGDDIDGEGDSDESGVSVSLSGDGTRVAIGAWRNDGNGNNAGHVRVYEYGGSSWTRLGLDIDGEGVGDQSGISVSLSSDGTLLAIGAHTNSNGNGNYSGHVRIFAYSAGSWTQFGSDIDGENASDESGFSVSLSGDGTRVAIGAPLNDDNGGNSGHVRVYLVEGPAPIDPGTLWFITRSTQFEEED